MDALELFDKKFKRKVTPDANNNMLIGVRACVFKKEILCRQMRLTGLLEYSFANLNSVTYIML